MGLLEATQLRLNEPLSRRLDSSPGGNAWTGIYRIDRFSLRLMSFPCWLGKVERYGTYHARSEREQHGRYEPPGMSAGSDLAVGTEVHGVSMWTRLRVLLPTEQHNPPQALACAGSADAGTGI